ESLTASKAGQSAETDFLVGTGTVLPVFSCAVSAAPKPRCARWRSSARRAAAASRTCVHFAGIHIWTVDLYTVGRRFCARFVKSCTCTVGNWFRVV
ncbi:MAG TPA: hypothetical protein VMV69_27580, partial [Pirellulales bacterium]|nr:hypothetical protein [Pirellulales bacterium]